MWSGRTRWRRQGGSAGSCSPQSSDSGQTWSPATVISKTPAGIDAFIPTVEVNASGDGRRDVLRLPKQHSGRRRRHRRLVRQLRHSACTDASNWAETHVAGPFDMHLAPVAGGEFIGDYMGMTTNGNSVPAVLHPDSQRVEPDRRLLHSGPVTRATG